MTSIADYDNMIEKTFDDVRMLGKLKGHEYAGTADRLANFKRNAEACGITMEQCWRVYAGKHWDAISQYVKDDAAGTPDVVRLEPLRGRVHDLIVYLLLFECMLVERERDRNMPPLGKRPGTGGFTQRPIVD